MEHKDFMEEELDLEELKGLLEMETSGPEVPEIQERSPEAVAGPEDAKPAVKNAPPSAQKSIVLYLHDLAYLIAGIVLVFLLCFRIVIVSGDSMYNTLVDGDYLLLMSNVFYHEPQQGDIIVASKENYDDGRPIIKRVIATEGQTVDIDFITGTVSVDGQVLDEEYIYTPTTTDEGVSFPLTVDEGCVFVLGDNRLRSKDSRNPEIGLIDTRQIVGKAVMLVFPGTDHGDSAPQFDRIGVID